MESDGIVPLDSFSASGMFSNPKCVMRESSLAFSEEEGNCWLARKEHEKQRNFWSDDASTLRRVVARWGKSLHADLEAIVMCGQEMIAALKWLFDFDFSISTPSIDAAQTLASKIGLARCGHSKNQGSASINCDSWQWWADQ